MGRHKKIERIREIERRRHRRMKRKKQAAKTAAQHSREAAPQSA